MAGQTLSGYDAVLKEDYGPRLRSSVNVKRVILTRFNRTSDPSDFQGRRAVLPWNPRGSESIGARADGGTTPSPQSQTFVDILVPMTYNYATVKFTLPTIKASASDEGAFERVMDAEMNGIRRDAMNDQNRQMWGDGFGSLGQINGAGAATTVLVLDAGHKVKRNMIIDAYTAKSGGTQQIDSIKVSSVSGTTATLASAQTWGDNSFAFREDSRGNEEMGIEGLVDDATFVATLHGIVRATYPEYNAQVLGNSGTNRPVTLDLLQQGALKSEEEGEGEISLGTTEFNIWRKIGNLMAPDRRYTPSMRLAGGFTALDFNDKPIIADRDHPRNTFFWLDESTFTRFELAEWDFDDTDGSILHKVNREAAYEGLLFHYEEMCNHDPANNVAIRDLIRT